jgi:CubicO group peptidase (beta-lactamase class C family)
VAAAVWKVLGDGLLDVNETVADIVPEFGTNGKEAVTVEHILSHSAGIPYAPLGYPKMLDRDARLAAFGRWRLDSTPGAVLQFHLTSAAWVIAEIVERRTGLPFADYLRTEIIEPLGLGIVLPLPADQYETALAVPTATDRTSDDQQVDPWGPWYLANPEVLAAGEPSHSIVGTAADVVQLSQALYCSGLWDNATVDDAIRIRISQSPPGDQLYGGSPETVNVGLFVVVSGTQGGGSYTPRTGSARTFGHVGAPLQMGFMDAVTGTSFAFLTNGYPMAGYDYSLNGVNLKISLLNLGNDLVSAAALRQLAVNDAS